MPNYPVSCTFCTTLVFSEIWVLLRVWKEGSTGRILSQMALREISALLLWGVHHPPLRGSLISLHGGPVCLFSLLIIKTIFLSSNFPVKSLDPWHLESATLQVLTSFIDYLCHLCLTEDVSLTWSSTGVCDKPHCLITQWFTLEAGGASKGPLRLLWKIPLSPSRTSFHVATVWTMFSLFVSIGVKATGKGTFSDLPQKSDHAFSSPYFACLSGAQWPAGDLLCMLYVLSVFLPACVKTNSVIPLFYCKNL